MAKTNKLCPLGHQGRGKFAALSAMHIQNKGRRGIDVPARAGRGRQNYVEAPGT
jgi:hypothetical protein